MYRDAILPVLVGLLLGATTAAPVPDSVDEVETNTSMDMSSSLLSFPTATTTTTTVAPTHTAPSTCQTFYPTLMRTLLEADPAVVPDNTANTTRAFRVAQSVSQSDNVKYDRIQQHVVFDNVAPGSWDCQLMVSWPEESQGNMNVGVSSIHGSSATSSVSLDVYSASYNASAYSALVDPDGAETEAPDEPFATWDGMMSALKISGNALSDKGDSERGQDKGLSPVNAKLTYFSTVAVNPGEYGITINSEACSSSSADTLGFIFEIPSTDSRDVSVSFMGENEEGAGIYLLANC